MAGTNQPSDKSSIDDAELNARVDLVRHTLYDVMFRNGWRRGSVFAFINRALLFVQHSVVLSFYKRNGDHHELWFTTLFDRMLQERFSSSLDDLHMPATLQAPRRLKPESADKFLHPLLDNRYGCLITTMDASGTDLIVTRVPCEPSNEISRLFMALTNDALWKSATLTSAG